jgi:hypothetical protein
VPAARADSRGAVSTSPPDSTEPPSDSPTTPRRNRAPRATFQPSPDPATHRAGRAGHPDRRGDGEPADRRERNDRFGAARAHSRFGRG